MGWFKQQCLSWIIVSAAAICVSCQELTSTLHEGNCACPGEEVTFTCTVRDSSGLPSLALAWSSTEYVGQDDLLQFTTANVPGASMINGDVIATLTNNTVIDGGIRVLESSLRIVAVQASTVTCTVTDRGPVSIQFNISAVPGAPRNGRATEISRIDNICVILVQWDPPAGSDGSDIDHYIFYIPSRNIMNMESSAITVLRVQSCHDDDGILVAASNRFGCAGMNSSEIQPILLPNPPTTESGSTTITPTEDGSTTVTVTPTRDGPTPTSAVIAVVVVVAVVGAVLFVMAILIIALGLFCIHYRTGKKIEAGDKESIKRFRDLQRNLQASLQSVTQEVNTMLKELYTALKSQPNDKIQDAAKSLRWKLKKESSKNNSEIKEALKNFLGDLQLESGADMQKVIHEMNSMITDMRSICEEFKESVDLLHASTEASNDEREKVIDDLIKKVDEEEVQPDKIIEILLTLCEKLQNTQQAKDYYKNQSRHDIRNLGTEKDRVSVPIWIHDTLDGGWKRSLHEAVETINEAAPGLWLWITEDEKGAIVHVRATDKEEVYTKGNILMRSIQGKADFIAEIYLGNWEDDRNRKGISIHELLHALGFHHEHQHPYAPSYVYHLDSGNQSTINKNWLNLTHFDPFNLSIMLYPCEKKIERNELPEVPIWLLKADSAQGKTELSELDKVGLNLVYPPCKDTTDVNVRYRPKHSKNGMYYCGRRVMKSHFYPYPSLDFTDVPCGPDDGPSCPACRTLKSPKVQMILDGGRWQGMTGLVYCGRLFTDPAPVGRTIVHDGNCGMNNGPACPECNKILKEEVKTVSAN